MSYVLIPCPGSVTVRYELFRLSVQQLENCFVQTTIGSRMTGAWAGHGCAWGPGFVRPEVAGTGSRGGGDRNILMVWTSTL